MSDDFDPAAYYRLALSPEDRERLPYYSALVDALAQCDVALELLVETRPEQRNPMLVLAALHYHALIGDDELAPLYHDLQERSPADFASSVCAVLERRPSLVREQLHRSTQTNEPGRSAVLGSVLRELNERGVSDVHLIDVGTSMGLNLYPDFYRVNDDPGDGVALTTEHLDSTGSSTPMARIHQRIGIDRHPLDPANPDDVLWLRACLWPEQPERADRLDEILRAMAHWPPATRLEGTALERIDEALERCTPDAVPLVFHSWVAAYFTPEEQVRWRERIMSHVRERALWIYFEHPWAVKGLEPPAAPSAAPRRGATQIVVCEVGADPAHWGWAHAHGRWISLTPP
ncbi:MAG: DUF2332 domain-containing protein [Acidimicrobiales bacterium]